MYSVYIIVNPQGKRYTGSTRDLEDRLKMHNDIKFEKAKFHKTTYKKGPWNIIYSKDFLTREEVLKFEKFLKTGKGRDWFNSLKIDERARLGG